MLKPFALCLTLTAALWAGQPTGNWKLSADAPDGRIYKFQLIVAAEGEKYSAKMDSPDFGVVALKDVAFANDELTFKLPHPAAGNVTFKLKVAEAALKGTLETEGGATGTVTGSKAETAPVSVDGKWKVVSKSADGGEMKVTLELSEMGGKMAGLLMTEGGDSVDISNVVVDGDRINFRVQTPEGALEVSGTIAGNQMKGTYKMPGSTGTFTATK
ncbi:MAG: hypothetical protein HY821_17060 [Acidobacteria bacterium]|nr:hypothetical protein [Acidobacteriota bacterium]